MNSHQLLNATIRLSENHRAELHASGISDEMIARAGIKTVADNAVAEVLGWQPTAHHWGKGLLIPFPGLNYARVKLDFPRVLRGKPVKYESPRGQPNQAYFPPGFRDQIADPTRLILITEGEKKALSAAQRGFATIGLVGVWGWLQARPKRADGSRRGSRRLLPELATLPWDGRQVFVVFDSDAAEKKDVRKAAAELITALELLGPSVRFVTLPALGDGKTGLDDFLVHHGDQGPAELQRLLDRAPKPETRDGCGRTVFEFADEFLRERFSGMGRFERPALVNWRDEFHIWRGTRYVTMPNAEFRRGVLSWLDGQVRGIRPKHAVEVTECAASRVLLPGVHEEPLWLGSTGGPANAADWLSVKNGILDLRSGQLLPHSPLWFSRTALPFAYDSRAACDHWLQFLDEVLDRDEERIELIQQWFGLCLTNDTRFHAILLLQGPRRSGKSTLLRILRAMVGDDNVCSPRLTTLGEPFGLMGLLGKRVAICPDAHVGHGDNALGVLEILKGISGEDAIEVMRKHLPPITVRLNVRFALAVNELPRFGDGANALLSRLLIVPFRQTFEGREDRHLESRLLTELPGILNWALEGLRDLRAHGSFVIPAASDEVREDFGRMSSPVEAFLVDACVEGPSENVTRDELYCAYRSWCSDVGHAPMSREVFGGRLKLVKPRLETRNARYGPGRKRMYAGLGLNAEFARRSAGGTSGAG